MDCNKEEAIRAKGIAENKMHNRDFFGAQKIVLKAQQLFPELENISQMLTVCEVHCAAGTKVNGETDWYGVLQVGPTADDSVIRKQYHKLAFLLHPDKNNFGGAEAAFKLVGEAHRTLADRDKRSLHDLKRGVGFRTASMRPVPPKKSAPPQFNGMNKTQTPSDSSSQTFWTMCSFCGTRYQYYQTIMNRALRCQSCMKTFVAYDLNAQPVPSAAAWNRTGKPQPEKPCPNAYYGGPKGNLGTAPGMATRESVSKGSTVADSATGTGMSMNVNKDATMERDPGAGNDEKFEKVKIPEVKRREQAAKPSSGHGSQKRGRKLIAENSDSESSNSDVAIVDGQPVGQAASGGSTRRSSRQKQNVSYKENRDDYDYDNDFVTPIIKKSRKEGISTNTQQRSYEFDDGKANGVQTDAAIFMNKNNKGKRENLSQGLPNGSHDVQHDAGERKSDLHTDASSTASAIPDTFSYPDPEFCDFGKERDESKYAAGQIWAAYDEPDAMPRYYAFIRQVYSPKFKMKFTWLEYDPATKDESMWYEGDLPIGCGSYKLGKSEFVEDCFMFSHLMHWKKGRKRNSFQIYPRKSEVWAIFKDWNIEWAIHVDDKRHYEYDVVEILSDFTEGNEITAVRLVKIQGFVGLFVKSTDRLTASLKLRECDILRFSHKIPSHRLTGNERQDIPKDSLELDCASLPPNFAATYPSVSLESIKVTVVDLDGSCSGPLSGAKKELPTSTTNNSSFGLSSKITQEEVQSSSSHSKEFGEPSLRNPACYAAVESRKHAESDEFTPKQQDGTKENAIHDQDLKSNDDERQSRSQPLSTNLNAYEYPDSEFHDFGSGRSPGMFEKGRIWALYSDIDSYPKYYGLATKVDLENFKVSVRWLEGYSDREEDRQWFKRRLPVSCGTFKITQEFDQFDSSDTFSHLVQAKPMTGTKHYVIDPTVGEIWALYKNWSPGWSYRDLKTCVFGVVEILASDSSGFKVSALTKVNGYQSVFKPQTRSGSELYIPIAERLKFSHQIPAFRLTEERGGNLRGYWELDPASVPNLLLCSP